MGMRKKVQPDPGTSEENRSSSREAVDHLWGIAGYRTSILLRHGREGWCAVAGASSHSSAPCKRLPTSRAIRHPPLQAADAGSLSLLPRLLSLK